MNTLPRESELLDGQRALHVEAEEVARDTVHMDAPVCCLSSGTNAVSH